MRTFPKQELVICNVHERSTGTAVELARNVLRFFVGVTVSNFCDGL